MRFLFFCLLLSTLSSACFHNDKPPRILVFSKTEGYRHESIPAGIAALRQLCRENQILMDTSEDAADFNERNLRRYAAVVFLNTTGDVLNPNQETEFQRYIQAGGGYVGVHSATDTEYGWKWYGGLAGGYFNGHPEIQQATLQVREHRHPATRHLKDDTWIRRDEWYNYKEFNPAVQVLLALDEGSYKGGEMCPGADPCHPISWCHEYDGGRAFYTGLGHTKESYSEPEFLRHLLGGLKYAIGKNRRLDYSACRTPALPDPTRFVKTVFASELTEPMEFDLLPDGQILFIERRGGIKLLNPATSLVTIVTKLPVHSEHEDGLMGLALDPAYERNHWIYLYYSPEGNESVNRLSRFVFVGDTLDRASERTLLEVDVQRQECCHTGGSIEFDGKGYLYLSTGDNTNPFASNGFDPIDEQPGRKAWDAQGSSGNTMDLRGKILRIKPLDDGAYLCPAGNLFTDREIKVDFRVDGRSTAARSANSELFGRPEIYVMGCRNPFRISLDPRRNLLFWGEVGPDAGEPDSSRGPAGHDEVNRARAAGFFGWPYFVGDNKAYRDFDFATSKSGPAFDAAQPRNNSPNNTGSQVLPPAQPAFIWYPYGNSPDFPLVGNGGRNAMAGPVYYTDLYPAETRLPDYYDGKLITYDWMRGWMMAVTIDSLGNFSRMEPFADSIRLSRPMDMLIDKNGSVWVLEYGTQWFSSNPDARVSRIDYVRGNRPPLPALEVDKIAGAAPLTLIFSVSKTRDYDADKLTYALDFDDETPPFRLENRPVVQAGFAKNRKNRSNPLDSIFHTFTRPGTYEVKLTVTDETGAFAVVKQKISVGNEPPVVRWDFGGRNRSFYQPGATLDYRLLVSDSEDGSLADGGIAPAAVATNIDYLATGFDITQIAQGHQSAKRATEYSRGKLLIDRSDCKTCHAADRQVNGPAYQAIAERYRNDEFAVRNLAKKVRAGGAGNWGQVVMSAHPQVSEEDAGEMVRWILSLGGPAKAKQSLPVTGQYALAIPPTEDGKKPVPGTFIFQASYRDRGSSTQSPLEEGETLALRPAFFQAESADSVSKGVIRYRPFSGDTVVLNDLKHNSFFVVKRAELGGLHGISLGIAASDVRYPLGGGRLELRLDGPKGPLAAQIALPPGQTGPPMTVKEVYMPLPGPADGRFHDLYFVLKNENNPSETVAAVDWVRFEVKN